MTTGDAWQQQPGHAWAPPARRPVSAAFWVAVALGTWVVLSLVLGVVARFTVLDVMYVPSGAMEPTIRVGDRVIVDTTAYRRGDPRRGDIVIFSGDDLLPLPGIRERAYVKRVVALGGDTVECCDPSGRLVVNGGAVDEPWVDEQEPFPRTTVPDGEMYLLGDNRMRSSDSRQHGPIPTDQLRGRVLGLRGDRALLALLAPFALGSAVAAVLVLGAGAVVALVRRRRPA